MHFQCLAVPAGVVHLQISFGKGGGSKYRLLRVGRLDMILCPDVEESAKGVERHAGGIGLTVGGVSGDVWRAEEYLI